MKQIFLRFYFLSSAKSIGIGFLLLICITTFVWAIPQRIPATQNKPRSVASITRAMLPIAQTLSAPDISDLQKYTLRTQAEHRQTVLFPSSPEKKLFLFHFSGTVQKHVPKISEGYLPIGYFLDHRAVAEKHRWLCLMHAEGIRSKLVTQADGASLLIRFAEDKELELVYASLFNRIAQITSIDETILRHVVFKESRRDETVISCVGASGVTQTLPVVIHEIMDKKRAAGSQQQINNTIRDLEYALYQTYKVDNTTETAARDHERATLVYRIQYFKILSLIPDYVLHPDPFVTEPIAVPPYLQKKLRLTTSHLPRIEYIALRHGPLNLLFGMVHLAHYYNIIEYYKAIGKIDPSTESLLAAQLSYNCGLSGMLSRLSSLGSWDAIFDRKRVQGKNISLPRETADYGYQFIKAFTQHAQTQGFSYRTHPQRLKHYTMCLTALTRSREYDAVLTTFKKKGLWSYYHTLDKELSSIIEEARIGTLSPDTLRQFTNKIASMPQWPLIKEIHSYLSTIVENMVIG